MARVQGSLEYLIIISIAISITAVVTLLTVNYFSSQQDQYYFASCRNAASTCNLILTANSEDPCDICNNACNYSGGAEIFAEATTCCKAGYSEGIYTGSTECTNLCTDAADCGGNACCDGACCAAGQVCDAGVCATAPVTCTFPQINCGGVCVEPECNYPSDCGANFFCATYACNNPGTCSADCSATYAPENTSCSIELPVYSCSGIGPWSSVCITDQVCNGFGSCVSQTDCVTCATGTCCGGAILKACSASYCPTIMCGTDLCLVGYEECCSCTNGRACCAAGTCDCSWIGLPTC